MLPETIILYFGGVASGSLTAWFIMSKRMEVSPDTRKLARDSATQAAFIRATSDVVDESTGREIRKRANEVLDEYDIPGNPTWHYDE